MGINSVPQDFIRINPGFSLIVTHPSTHPHSKLPWKFKLSTRQLFSEWVYFPITISGKFGAIYSGRAAEKVTLGHMGTWKDILVREAGGEGMRSWQGWSADDFGGPLIETPPTVVYTQWGATWKAWPQWRLANTWRARGGKLGQQILTANHPGTIELTRRHRPSC